MFLPQLSCFALWTREGDDAQRTAGTFTITLNNDAMTHIEMFVDFATPAIRRSRSTINVNALVIPHSGTLHFRFLLETGSAAEYSVDIEAPPAVQTQ